MQLLLCSVLDLKTDTFMAPFSVRTKGEAIRSFTDAVNDPKMAFGAHPADYVLCSLGRFDDNSGVIDPVSVERWVSAEDVKRSE